MSWDGQDRRFGWSTVARWTMGPLQAADWQVRWIGLDSRPGEDTCLEEGIVAAPRYLRRAFSAARVTIRQATAYVTALGVYELRLNGGRAGDRILAPEWTDYHKRIQCQVCDVTCQVTAGENVLGAVLGNGWYSGLWQGLGPRVHL
jgi:alpha-L-rhamnosidase